MRHLVSDLAVLAPYLPPNVDADQFAKIGRRVLGNIEPGRGANDQAPQPVGVGHGELSRQPPAHRQAGEVELVGDLQGVQEVQIVQHIMLHAADARIIP